jgi:hypothetical protein
MTNLEGLIDLFTMLKIKHTPKKHLSDSIEWGIVKFMNEMFELTQNVVTKNFIYGSANEVITIDNTS